MPDLRCQVCDTMFVSDWDKRFCDKHYARHQLTSATGLSTDDLPDGLPIEDFVDETGNLDYDAISAW